MRHNPGPRPQRPHFDRLVAATILAIIVFAAIAFSQALALAETTQGSFRLRVAPAACVTGERVTLGEIASLVGSLPEGQWKKLAATELWPAPERMGRPAAMGGDKLYEALRHYLGDVADLAILPQRLVLQRGGKVVDADTVRKKIVKALTPHLRGMEAYGEGGEKRPGRAELREFRLPDFLFLEDPGSSVAVEPVGAIEPGRLGLRVYEVGPRGDKGRSVTAGVFIDLWRAVPCAAIPLNRGDALTPEKITHVNKNMAYERGEMWDGFGGPWRVTRPVGEGQVITADHLEAMPVIQKGDAVSLVYDSAKIRLQVNAEAMQDGATGETIPVRNLQSKRTVYARVQNADTVTVN